MPTYYDYNRVVMGPEESRNLVGALIICCFLTMALDVTTPEVVFFVALCILMLAEVMTLNEVLAGFANEGLITIGALFLVIGTIEKSHCIDYGARLAFGMRNSPFWGKLRLYTSSFFISLLFNNIPQVAILIPIVKDWAKLRGIASSQLLIPLSYTVLAGGMLATIGTSTNLAVNALLAGDKANREQFNFFDPAVVGLPGGAVLIMYMIIAGPHMLPHHPELVEIEDVRHKSHVAELTFEKSSKFVGFPVRDILGRFGVSYKMYLKIRRPLATAVSTEVVDESGIKVEETTHFFKSVEETPVSFPKDPKAMRDMASVESTKVEPKAAPRPPRFPLLEAIGAYFAGHIATVKSRWNEFILANLPKLYVVDPSVDGIFTEKYASPVFGTYEDLYGDDEIEVQAGDTMFIGDAATVYGNLSKTMPWERTGLKGYGDISLIDYHIYGNSIVRVTLAGSSHYIGSNVANVAINFSAKYAAAIVSVRSKDATVAETVPDKLDATHDHVLGAGDSILVITSRKIVEEFTRDPQFLSVDIVGETCEPVHSWTIFPIFMFMTVVSLVASEQVEMCPAAMSMAAFLFVGGWLLPKEIETFVDIRLLMLMGASISFAKSMETTGLAKSIAIGVAGSVGDATNGLWVFYLATLIITEIISNNAAAAIMYPISVALADELKVSYKPFAMIVMQAASMAFMCPIGYPTHVMVWRPGQYGFLDFMYFGAIPNVIWWVMTCIIVPAVWPF